MTDTHAISEDARLTSPFGPVRTSVGWWASRVAEAVASHGVIKQDGTIVRDFGDYMAKTLTQALSSVATGSLQQPAVTQATMFRLGTWMPIWGHFVACGCQLFDLDTALVQDLNSRPLDKALTLGHLKAPAPAFYVRFGRQEQLDLPWSEGSGGVPEREYVDGAFISFMTDGAHPTLAIGLTLARANGQGFLTPGNCLKISGEHFELPVQDALRNAVQDALETATVLRRGLAENPHGALADMGEAMSRVEAETAEIFQRAWPLLINTIYRLGSRAVPALQVSEGAPEALAKKALKVTTGPARYRATAALYAAGHTPLRRVSLVSANPGAGS